MSDLHRTVENRVPNLVRHGRAANRVGLRRNSAMHSNITLQTIKLNQPLSLSLSLGARAKPCASIHRHISRRRFLWLFLSSPSAISTRYIISLYPSHFGWVSVLLFDNLFLASSLYNFKLSFRNNSPKEPLCVQFLA